MTRPYGASRTLALDVSVAMPGLNAVGTPDARADHGPSPSFRPIEDTYYRLCGQFRTDAESAGAISGAKPAKIELESLSAKIE